MLTFHIQIGVLSKDLPDRPASMAEALEQAKKHVRRCSKEAVITILKDGKAVTKVKWTVVAEMAP
jgi:hypothetical protein